MNPRMRVNRVRVHVQRLLTEPVTELSRAQRSVRYVADLGRHCARELVHDRAGTMAAALTFHTMFSLLPTLALMLVVLQAFVSDSQLEQLKDGTVSYVLQWLETTEEAKGNIEEVTGTAPAGPPTLLLRPEEEASPPAPAPVSTTPPTPTGAPTAPTAAQPTPRPRGGVGGLFSQISDLAMLRMGTPEAEELARQQQRELELEQTAASVRKNIQGWLDQLENISFSSIGITSVLLFVYAATALLGTIESSFNRIFDAPSGRRWYIRLPMYYTVITLGPLVILGGQYLQGQLLDMVAAAAVGGVPIGGLGKTIAGVLSFLSPVVTTWMVLIALYTLLPHTLVRLRFAAIGALVGTIGWVGLIELFGLYVRTAAVATLYGALALLPLFLMWLWITWLIILFGLELSYALQHLRTGRFKSLKGLSDEDLLVDPRWIVPVMALVAERFEEGHTVGDSDIARRLSLPVRAVRKLTGALATERLLHQTARVDGDEDEASWTLARPPASIRLADLLEVGDELSLARRADPDVPGLAALNSLREHQRRDADGQTLAALLPGATSAEAGPSASLQG